MAPVPTLEPVLRWSTVVVVATIGILAGLGGCGAWAVLLMAIVVVSHVRRTSVMHRRRLTDWIIRSAHRHQLMRTTGLPIPDAIDFSTTEKCIWLNRVLEQLWPFARVGIEHMLRDTLDPLLEDAAESLALGLKLQFRQLRLGTRPPLVTGVNTLRTSAGVSIDLTLQLAGGSDVVVEAKAGGVAVVARLTDLVVDGVFRITLAALSPDSIPGFKALNITCVRKPDIRFNLSAVEIPLTSIPGLSDAIKKAVQSGVASAIVWPWSVSLPLFTLTDEEQAMMLDRSGDGVLRVVVVSADNIPRPNAFRHPNAFATCTVNGAKPQKTRTVDGTANPAWGERMEWVVHDWATASFECEVADVGSMTSSGQSFGKAAVDLASLRPFAVQPFRLRLPEGGHVTLQLEYCPFAAFGIGRQLPLDLPDRHPEAARPVSRGGVGVGVGVGGVGGGGGSRQPVAAGAGACPGTPPRGGVDFLGADPGMPNAALLYIEVLGCSGLPPGESTTIRVDTQTSTKTTHAAIEHGRPKTSGEAMFCPVDSVSLPVDIMLGNAALQSSSARVELTDSTGKALLGSTPEVREVTIPGRRGRYFEVKLKLALKLPALLDDDMDDTIELYAARYEVPSVEAVPPLIAATLFRDAIGLGSHEDLCAYGVVFGALMAGYIFVEVASVSVTANFALTVFAATLVAVVILERASVGDGAAIDAVIRPLLGAAVGGTAGAAPDSGDGGPSPTAAAPPLGALDRAVLLQQLPPWMAHPDAEKSEWMNDALELLWPTLRPCLEKTIVDTVKWALGKDSPITFKRCSLGSQPPAVTGIKCHSQTVRGSNVVVDLAINLAGEVGAAVSIAAGPVDVPITLTDVACEVILRIELGPPIAQVPPIGGIQVRMVKPENFMLDCHLNVAGVRLSDIPGVRRVVQDVVLAQLMQVLFIPHGISVPLGTVSVAAGAKAESGVGILRVHLRRAIGLPRQPATVQSALGLTTMRPSSLVELLDPRRKGPVVMERASSRSASAPINPIWDERLEVLVPTSKATLRLSVINGSPNADYHLLGRARDIVIGTELKPNAVTHCATALSTVRGSEGTMQVDLEWKPFVDHFVQPVTGRTSVAGAGDMVGAAVFDWAVGVIFVTIVGIRGLENTSCVSHVKVTTAGETRQTRSQKGVNPDFGANFHFMVQYVAQQKVAILVVDHRSGDAVGDVRFNVSDVVHGGGKLAGMWDLHGSDHAKAELVLEFRGVSPEVASADSLFVKASTVNVIPPPTPPPPSRRRSAAAFRPSALGSAAPLFHDSGLNLVAAAAGVALSHIGIPKSLTPTPPRGDVGQGRSRTASRAESPLAEEGARQRRGSQQ